MRLAIGWSKITCITLAVSAFLACSPVAAQEKPEGEWGYWFELYGWLPQLKITDTAGDETNLKFKDLLKNLDMVFMGDIGMRNGDWSLGLDTIYMNMGGEETVTGNIIGRPQELDAEVDVRSVISTLAAGYTVYRTPEHRLDVIGGARYIYLKQNLVFDIQATPGEKRAILGGSQWDFLLGLRGRYFFNDQWHMDYYGDVGSGASKITWQGKLGFGYNFNKWTATFGFRYMSYKFDDLQGLDRLEVIGPYVGARWTW